MLAGIPPIDLAVKERKVIYNEGKEQKNMAREELLRVWQTRWESYDGWSNTFIKNVKEWTSRQYTEANYYLTQAITDHEVFGTYLEKIGKKENADCWFCGELDTPEQTVFLCCHFEELRRNTSEDSNSNNGKHRRSTEPLKSKRNWQVIALMLETIMKIKVKEEKRLETTK